MEEIHDDAMRHRRLPGTSGCPGLAHLEVGGEGIDLQRICGVHYDCPGTQWSWSSESEELTALARKQTPCHHEFVVELDRRRVLMRSLKRSNLQGVNRERSHHWRTDRKACRSSIARNLSPTKWTNWSSKRDALAGRVTGQTNALAR